MDTTLMLSAARRVRLQLIPCLFIGRSSTDVAHDCCFCCLLLPAAACCCCCLLLPAAHPMSQYKMFGLDVGPLQRPFCLNFIFGSAESAVRKYKLANSKTSIRLEGPGGLQEDKRYCGAFCVFKGDMVAATGTGPEATNGSPQVIAGPPSAEFVTHPEQQLFLFLLWNHLHMYTVLAADGASMNTCMGVLLAGMPES
jgi:hypothetical protein